MPRAAALIDHDDIIAELAIVRNMRVGHKIAAVADARRCLGLGRLVYGDRFPEDIVIADDDLGCGVVKMKILRIFADGRAGENLVVRTDSDFVLDCGADAHFGARADFDLGADIGEGVHDDIVGKVRGIFDDRGGVDFRHGSRMNRGRQRQG